MAVVERTIRQDGTGDYTSIAAWHAAANLNGGADIWKGVIDDSNAYDEALVMDAGGTDNTTSYLWLTVSAGNRHAGVWDTSKARITYTGADTAAIELASDFAMLEWLQIYRPSSGSIGISDEAIRISGDPSEGCLISRCLMWTESLVGQVSSTDGIYIGSTTLTSLSIDHCVIYGWGRSGVHLQMNNGSNNQNVEIDHCSLRAGGDKSDQGALNIHQNGSAGASVARVRNTWLREISYTPDGADLYTWTKNTASSVTVEGSNNAYAETDTDNGEVATVSWSNNQVVTSTSPTDTAPASPEIYIVSEPIDTNLFDATPVDHANNALLANGTNRIGLEPDPRQDFSTDITGATRPTTNVDIGAFQVSGAGSGPTSHTADGTMAGTTSTTSTGAKAVAATATMAATTGEGGAVTHAGFAAGVTGGDAQAVVTVTNLNDSGAGSLRDALTAGNRLIEFDQALAGAVTLASELFIDNIDNVTVDGGGAISVDGDRVRLTNCDNFLWRNVEFAGGADNLWIRSESGAARANNVAFVQCTFTGATNNAINATWNFGNDLNLSFAHCRFHALKWGAILDGGGSNEGGTYQTSFHDCWFDDVIARLPFTSGVAGHTNKTHLWNCLIENYGDADGTGSGVYTDYESQGLIEYCVGVPRDVGSIVGATGATVTTARSSFSHTGASIAAPGIHENIGNTLGTSLDTLTTATESGFGSGVSIPYSYTANPAPDTQTIRDSAGAGAGGSGAIATGSVSTVAAATATMAGDTAGTATASVTRAGTATITGDTSTTAAGQVLNTATATMAGTTTTTTAGGANGSLSATTAMAGTTTSTATSQTTRAASTTLPAESSTSTSGTTTRAATTTTTATTTTASAAARTAQATAALAGETVTASTASRTRGGQMTAQATTTVTTAATHISNVTATATLAGATTTTATGAANGQTVATATMAGNTTATTTGQATRATQATPTGATTTTATGTNTRPASTTLTATTTTTTAGTANGAVNATMTATTVTSALPTTTRATTATLTGHTSTTTVAGAAGAITGSATLTGHTTTTATGARTRSTNATMAATTTQTAAAGATRTADGSLTAHTTTITSGNLTVAATITATGTTTAVTVVNPDGDLVLIGEQPATVLLAVDTGEIAATVTAVN